MIETSAFKEAGSSGRARAPSRDPLRLAQIAAPSLGRADAAVERSALLRPARDEERGPIAGDRVVPLVRVTRSVSERDERRVGRSFVGAELEVGRAANVGVALGDRVPLRQGAEPLDDLRQPRGPCVDRLLRGPRDEPGERERLVERHLRPNRDERRMSPLARAERFAYRLHVLRCDERLVGGTVVGQLRRRTRSRARAPRPRRRANRRPYTARAPPPVTCPRSVEAGGTSASDLTIRNPSRSSAPAGRGLPRRAQRRRRVNPSGDQDCEHMFVAE